MVVTRPRSQGETLCEMIEKAGGHALHFPALEIEPLPLDQFSEKFSSLSQFDWLIFLSPNAVRFSIDGLKKILPNFPGNLKVAVIGPGTAARLKEAGIKVGAIPVDDYRTEGLLVLPFFKDVKNKKIALIKGTGGRDLLAKTLKERGALVTEIAVYERRLPKSDIYAAQTIDFSSVDAMVATSTESLSNLETLIDENNKAYLHAVKLVVISERIKSYAKELGYQQIFLSNNASDDCLMQVLKGLCMEEVQNKAVISNPKNSRNTFPWLGLGFAFSTIAVIILFGLFFYAIVRGSDLSQQLVKTVSQLQIRVDETQTNLETIKKEHTQANENFEKSITALQQTLSSNPNTWHVNETQFYVNLADSQLRFENNVTAAIQLLQLADQSIKNLSDPTLDNIRRALAQDIAALQAVPLVDVTGIYMRLAALNNQIDQLPTMNQAAENQSATTAVDSKAPWWKKGLTDSFNALEKIVVIRYNNSNMPPLVTPTQKEFLIQNMHALVEKTMWALLHRQPEIYKESLAQTIQWSHLFFMSNSPLTQSFVTNLNQLQEIVIDPKLPSLTLSQQALHDYFASGGKS